MYKISVMFGKYVFGVNLVMCSTYFSSCMYLCTYVYDCQFYLEGIFAPLSKISKFGLMRSAISHNSLQKLNHGKVQVSHITAKVDTGDNHCLLPFMPGFHSFVTNDDVSRTLGWVASTFCMFLCMCALCWLRGCKNRPAPFPGRMS